MLANQTATSLGESTYSTHAHLSTMLFYLQNKLSPSEQDWLLSAIAAINQGEDSIEETATRVTLYTATVKQNILDSSVDIEMPLYQDSGVVDQQAMSLMHWTLLDVARITLIAVALTGTSNDPMTLLEKIYDFSDHSEKISLIRGLYWLSDDPALLDFAERIQRTNAVDEFCALAQFNPLPAKCYSDPVYNQLVLKSLFLKTNIERIVGFPQRCSAELGTMCENYLHELRLADREFPASLWLALSIKDVCKETVAQWNAALESKVDEQRYYAIKSLKDDVNLHGHVASVLSSTINDRVRTEQHPVILALVKEVYEANL